MGFYGNITNIARTQFSFDKIYPNRKSMEQSTISDGIYLGRYVLVEYDDDGLDGMKEVTIANGQFYYGPEDERTLLTWKNTGKDEVVYNIETEVVDSIEAKKYVFYKCNSCPVNANGDDPATFTKFTNGGEDTYTRNHAIDVEAYKSSRGYDSTVWQKVFSDEAEKYVMIAELNTVVPKFDIATDAPTMIPVAPHFDTQSTDVYYKLHMQNPWVVRVAEAKANEPSDSTTKWVNVIYDEKAEEGYRYSVEEVEKKAAIYFNKAGFKEDTPSKVSGENNITMSLASSGQKIYDDHDNTTDESISANDIQELTINLPGIGNMMSDAWDIIHGDDRQDSTGDDHPSLQGRLNAFSAMKDNTIAIKRSKDGTLVGTQINGNTNRTVDNILNETLDIDNFAEDDAWIKVNINTVGLNNDTDLQGISIHHTFHPVAANTTSNSNKNIDEVASDLNSDKIDLYTPIVDAAGHVVGKNTETVTLPYGFKTIKTNGRGDEESENASGTPATPDVVADNTQDELAINSGNKWIRIDTDAANDSITIRHDVHKTSTSADTTDWTKTELNTTIPVPAYSFDQAGHYVSAHTESYQLPFGYGKIKGDNNTFTAATATYDELSIVTGDNWLTSTVSDDAVTITHDFTAQNDTETKANKNNDSDNDNDKNAINKGKGDTLKLYTPIIDAKGHVVGENTEIVTLPFGYKTFTGDSGSTSADNTQDTMSVTGDNKWVQTTVSEDNIAFTHIGPVSGTVTEVSAKTPDFGTTFSIDDHYFDDKGHKFASKSHTVQIPLPSLANGIGNVVTGLSLNAAKGAFIETKADIGTLIMTGYEKPTTLANQALSAAESLNTTIGKLEYRLEDEAKRAVAAEGKVLTDAKHYTDEVKKEILTGGSSVELKEAYDTLVEIQQWIEGDGVNATELTKAIADEANRASNEEARLANLIQINSNNIASFGTAANHPEEYFVSKTQYDLDMSTKDAQINGLNFEAKRLTNELNALQEKFNSLYEIVKQLHPEAF